MAFGCITNCYWKNLFEFSTSSIIFNLYFKLINICFCAEYLIIWNWIIVLSFNNLIHFLNNIKWFCHCFINFTNILTLQVIFLNKIDFILIFNINIIEKQWIKNLILFILQKVQTIRVKLKNFIHKWIV